MMRKTRLFYIPTPRWLWSWLNVTKFMAVMQRVATGWVQKSRYRVELGPAVRMHKMLGVMDDGCCRACVSDAMTATCVDAVFCQLLCWTRRPSCRVQMRLVMAVRLMNA